MRRLITRKDLYELIWASPTSIVAKEFEISDVLLARICRSSNVPIPDRGYWAKKRAGKPVLQAHLPPRSLGEHDEVEIGRGSSYGLSDSEVLASPLPSPPSFEGNEQSLREQVSALVQKVPIPRSLADCHHEIAKLLKADEVRREKLRESPYSWHQPLFESRIERRRLRILNALFIWASRNAFGCAADGKFARRAGIRVGDQTVSFTLNRVGAKEPEYDDGAQPIPEDAKLCLKFTWWEPPPEVRLEWQDTADHLLEDQLLDIAREIAFAGEWGYRWWKIRSHALLVERRAELEAAERARIAEALRKENHRLEGLLTARREALWAEAAAWRRAADLRSYVQLVVAREPNESAWASWALAEADRVDPVVTGSITR
jgi:hypothetical protein